MGIISTMLWVTLILNTIHESLTKYMSTTFKCKLHNIHSGWAECLILHFVPTLCILVIVHFSVKLWFPQCSSNSHLSTMNDTKPQGLLLDSFFKSLKSLLGCIPKSENVSCWDCNANSTFLLILLNRRCRLSWKIWLIQSLRDTDKD